jgi:YVTN family beta-propeller protein
MMAARTARRKRLPSHAAMVPAHAAAVLLALLASAILTAASASAEQSLLLEKSIPLEGVSGRIDHLAIDLKGQRLFVAELGNNSVGIVDLAAGKVIHRIGGLQEPQGVAYLAAQDMIVVAGGGDGSVRFFSANDVSPVGSLALGDDADNIRGDPASGQIVVGYGDGALAIIDPSSRTKLADIRLPGHPESFQLAPRSAKVFVNVPDAHQIAVVDLSAKKQIANWDTHSLRSNFPMAWRDPDGPLAVVFRNPAKLALLDAETGGVIQSLKTCGDADDVFFDGKRDRIYVSCGEGAVDVMQRRPEGYRRLDRVKTASGARTSLFVPDLDRLFVAARAGRLGSSAAILVLRPAP